MLFQVWEDHLMYQMKEGYWMRYGKCKRRATKEIEADISSGQATDSLEKFCEEYKTRETEEVGVNRSLSSRKVC